jgi:hypothetical protein
VTDQVTDESVVGATVTVVDTDLPTASTDSDGAYAVPGVPGGTYTVAFEADGYLPLVVEDVAVTDGAVTTLDAALESAPVVAVVGDRLGQITAFLNDRSIPAFEVAGWEITDQLDGVDVVVLQNPPNLTNRDEFLAHLDAFDEAGVSVIFPAARSATRPPGIDLLVRHTGHPTSCGTLTCGYAPSAWAPPISSWPLLPLAIPGLAHDHNRVAGGPVAAAVHAACVPGGADGGVDPESRQGDAGGAADALFPPVW